VATTNGTDSYAPNGNHLSKPGTVRCWRCHELITHDPTKRGGGWVIGHDDWNRSITRGPEHQRCNELAAHDKATAIRLGRATQPMIVRREW
jgi:hypothetical protein